MVAIDPGESKDREGSRGANLLDLAVRDNARWCRLVSATWGAVGTVDADAWTSPTRTRPDTPMP